MKTRTKARDPSGSALETALCEQLFFQGFDSLHIRVLSQCAQTRTLSPGEYLWHQGEPGQTCFLIQRGQVALEISVPNQGTLAIDVVGDGELLGWSGLMEPYRWRFDARAVSVVQALAFDTRCLREKCEHDHELGYQLLKKSAPVVGQRLDAARLKFIEMYREEMP